MNAGVDALMSQKRKNVSENQAGTGIPFFVDASVHPLHLLFVKKTKSMTSGKNVGNMYKYSAISCTRRR